MLSRSTGCGVPCSFRCRLGVPSTPLTYTGTESGGSFGQGSLGQDHGSRARPRTYDGSMAMPLQASRCKWMMIQVPTEERDPVATPCALNSHVVFVLAIHVVQKGHGTVALSRIKWKIIEEER